MFAYKFGFPPDVVDKMEADEVEAFSIILEKISEKMGGNDPTMIDKLFEKGM